STSREIPCPPGASMPPAKARRAPATAATRAATTNPTDDLRSDFGPQTAPSADKDRDHLGRRSPRRATDDLRSDFGPQTAPSADKDRDHLGRRSPRRATDNIISYVGPWATARARVDPRLIACLAAVYLIWSSTYLAMRIVVQE